MLRYAPDSLGGGGPGFSAGNGGDGTHSVIRHSSGGVEGPESKPRIRTFEKTFAAGQSEEEWKRKPNPTGNGAVHCRTFHCKLTGDCLENLDRQINEWLDAHPNYEVKLVNTTVGDWTGKLKEPNLIVQVWV
jgi:hypothetical protein